LEFYTWFFLFLPYLDSNGISFGAISLAYVFLSLIGIPFAKIGQLIYKKFKHEKPFLLIGYGSYLLWALLVIIPGKFFAYIYWFVRWNFVSLFMPIENAYKESHIPEQRRSTINSIQTIIDKGANSIGPIIGGLLLSITTPSLAIFYSSLLIIPVMIIISFIRK
jgi:predicted MFS family arabinose efflux permease